MKENKQCNPDIGGQAVLEGVMMRSPEYMAIAVRRENGDIVVKRSKNTAPSEKHKWMGWPFIRGAVNLVLMMKLGMGVMQDSTEMLGVLDEEPGRFEKWLTDKLGKKAEKLFIAFAMVLAFILSMGLFVLLPNLPVKALRANGWSLLSVNLLSGLIRTLILIVYLWACGFQKDLRRTFQYHGSEHKTVYCHENGLPLTVENVQKFSTLHPRCGTSFLLLTFISSIIFYSVLDQLIFSISGYDLGTNYGVRVLSRLLLLPVVAGISYELLKGLAHANTPLTRALRWPGMQLQRLTTRQPDDSMCEIAITSMKAALYDLPEGEITAEGWVVIKKNKDEEPKKDEEKSHDSENIQQKAV
ncbi:MAG: DUF1385 domain-containing protein [Eubacteriales bacterium]|nr:DUF1385 domain-containing protein [Eubacteriales bacterium]